MVVKAGDTVGLSVGLLVLFFVLYYYACFSDESAPPDGLHEKILPVHEPGSQTPSRA